MANSAKQKKKVRKKDPAVATGRTRQNKLVHFAPPHALRVGSYATVEVTQASAGATGVGA